MTNVLAVNGSPVMEHGETAMMLSPFIQGMEEAGAEVKIIYPGKLDLKSCSCGNMYCWNQQPGKCCLRDDMQHVYPSLEKADILVLATPVYIPLPGKMQDFINRLCPLIEPCLEWRDGRTRARFRKTVHIQKIVLIATGGWWEKENFDTVIRIAEELAADASVPFAGAVIRPHSFLMKRKQKLTPEGQAILDETRMAGYQLVHDGSIFTEILSNISRPLITKEALWELYN